MKWIKGWDIQNLDYIFFFLNNRNNTNAKYN